MWNPTSFVYAWIANVSKNEFFVCLINWLLNAHTAQSSCMYIHVCFPTCVYLSRRKVSGCKTKVANCYWIITKVFIQPNGHLNKAKVEIESERNAHTHTFTKRDNKNNVFGIKSIGNVNGSRFYLLIHRQFVLVNMLRLYHVEAMKKGENVLNRQRTRVGEREREWSIVHVEIPQLQTARLYDRRYGRIS